MILIFTGKQDITADKVCNWLFHYNASFVRINNYDYNVEISNFKISNEDNTNFKIKVNNHSFYFNETNVVWFRRGNLKFRKNKHFSKLNKILLNCDFISFTI